MFKSSLPHTQLSWISMFQFSFFFFYLLVTTNYIQYFPTPSWDQITKLYFMSPTQEHGRTAPPPPPRSPACSTHKVLLATTLTTLSWGQIIPRYSTMVLLKHSHSLQKTVMMDYIADKLTSPASYMWISLLGSLHLPMVHHTKAIKDVI